MHSEVSTPKFPQRSFLRVVKPPHSEASIQRRLRSVEHPYSQASSQPSVKSIERRKQNDHTTNISDREPVTLSFMIQKPPERKKLTTITLKKRKNGLKEADGKDRTAKITEKFLKIAAIRATTVIFVVEARKTCIII